MLIDSVIFKLRQSLHTLFESQNCLLAYKCCMAVDRFEYYILGIHILNNIIEPYSDTVIRELKNKIIKSSVIV